MIDQRCSIRKFDATSLCLCSYGCIDGGGGKVFLVLCALFLVSADLFSADQPALVLLKETGQKRDGKPVLAPTTDTQVSKILSHGFASHTLRLFQYEQIYLQKKGGPAPEPAYLLLSSRQGGFPCYGFYLGAEDKHNAAYVDLWEDSSLTGRFGSMDQIFPHEMGHVFINQLAGTHDSIESNQVHAIGVRTDPDTAFDEGFGEHFQVMALDDPDIDPATRSLRDDTRRRDQAFEKQREYGRELAALWSIAGHRRMTFPLWFSETEQALRYYAVKSNLFAYESEIPDRLLDTNDPYAAYLIDSVCVGQGGRQLKSPARMMSIEGVVSTFLYRLATSNAVQQKYRDEAFYAQFDTIASQVSPLQNAYLKLFHAMYTHKTHDLVRLIEAYEADFPDESAAVNGILKATFGGETVTSAPAIWLANNHFHTGTTLFDQFRGVPRVHTFDLNAASLVDLMGVPGMTRALAESVLKGAPFERLDALERMPGMTSEMMSTFREMDADMGRFHTSKSDTEENLPLNKILYPYLWHALFWLFAAAVLGAALYRYVRRIGNFRLMLNGTGAAFVCLIVGWLYAEIGFTAILAPLLLFGLPAAIWQLIRQRAWRPALRVLAAWAAASLPAALFLQPLL